LGFVALGATLLFAMRGTERVAARLLGLPTFRWFEAAAAPGWTGKRCLVRVVSATTPFAICASLFFVVLLMGGVQEPTTTVEVLAGGAAQEAGMRDGDKVLAVGSVPVHTWDEARAQIQTHSDPVRITLERAGKRHELMVMPRDRRIGVAPVSVMRPVGILAAATRSVRMPVAVVTEAAKSFVALHHTSEIRGPVGIVRDTGQAAKAGWLSYLFFLAVLGSYFWPFAAALHLFDVVTGWTFRLTLTETDLPERTLRIARLRFSLHFALGCWLAFLLAEAAAGFELPGALLLVALLTPGVWALWPLLWVSARELWGKGSPFGVTLSVLLVPCAAPLMGVWVALCLRKEELRLRSHPMAG
jgi:hypothetical protein